MIQAEVSYIYTLNHGLSFALLNLTAMIFSQCLIFQHRSHFTIMRAGYESHQLL